MVIKPKIKFDKSNPDESIQVAEVACLCDKKRDVGDWYAVMDDRGVIAYFGNENNACFFKEMLLKFAKRTSP